MHMSHSCNNCDGSVDVKHQDNSINSLDVKRQHDCINSSETHLSSVESDLFHPTREPDHMSEEPFLGTLEFKTKALVIKAGLGKGKTTALIRHLDQSRYPSILIGSPRKSFTHTMYERLSRECPNIRFERYDNCEEKKLDEPYIICQAESLYRLTRKSYDIVVLDEAESFLYQLTSIETHKQRLKANVAKFEALIHKSKRVLLMDAFISNRSLSLLQDLAIPFTFVHYTRPYAPRVCQRSTSEDGWLNSLIIDLKSGKNIFLFCSSFTQLTSQILPNVSQQIPDVKVLQYHRQSPERIHEDINTAWLNVQLVATTCTITVGCNFDVPGIFHKVYVFASASSRNLVRDMFQATYRVRSLVDNEMVYYLNPRHYGVSLPVTTHEVRSRLDLKEQLLEYSLTAPTWLTNLCTWNVLEYNLSIMRLEPIFEQYLKECGYTECLSDEEVLVHMEFAVFPAVEYEYDDIPEIDPADISDLTQKRNSKTITTLETAQLEKYYFQSTIGNVSSQTESTLWDIYSQHGRDKFRNLSYEKALDKGTITLDGLMQRHGQVYRVLSKGFPLQCTIIQEIKQILGITHTQKFDAIINPEQLIALRSYMHGNEAKIMAAFELRPRRVVSSSSWSTRNVLDFVNQVFHQWDFSKLQKKTRKRLKINNNIIEVSMYGLTNTVNVNVYENITTANKANYQAL